MATVCLALVEAFGENHPNVATFLNNLAALYYSLGDYAKAEPLYQRSLVINEKALGPDHRIVEDARVSALELPGAEEGRPVDVAYQFVQCVR